MVNIKPLFKYAGSKARMLDNYEPMFHGLDKMEYFIDYFGGTGTMSLWIKSKYPYIKIVLNELNPEIFGLYNALQNNYEEFIKYLRLMDARYTEILEEGLSLGLSREIVAKPRSPLPESGNKIPLKEDPIYKDFYPISREAYYYSLRDKYISTPKDFFSVEKSATLYFMLLTNFNGIWQTRAEDGVYYTPFGRGEEVNSRVDEEALASFHALLDDAIIMNTDFRGVHVPWKNTVHYFDPPYIESYTDYTGEGFSPQDTEDLCKKICQLHQNGHIVFLSNKYGEELRKHFDGVLKTELFNVRYTAGRVNDQEGSKAVEVLFHNNPYSLKNKGVREEEYKELVKLLEPNYFTDKIEVDSDGCWIWMGYDQVKKAIEERVNTLRAKPYKILWMIYNKRIPPPNGSLKRTCTKEDCCNPTHREYLNIEGLKKVKISTKFLLPKVE